LDILNLVGTTAHVGGKKEGIQNSGILTAGAGTTLRMRKNFSYKRKRQ